tara:strand:- start:2027 stop:2671 length:645 start_codon:yes stop_codon:yes gene_type:complete
MKFNKGRFAKLAGLPQSRGTLNESRRRKALRRRAMLNENLYGGKRAEMDMMGGEDALDDEGRLISLEDIDDALFIDPARLDAQMDRPQSLDYDLNYDDMGSEFYERESSFEMDDDDYPLAEGMDEDMYEGDMDEEEEEKKEEMVEIDDAELMKEVRNIKRKRINEARLKAVIEDELREVLAEMQYGSGWMYGEDKPTASKKGHVTRGFKGLGFK